MYIPNNKCIRYLYVVALVWWRNHIEVKLIPSPKTPLAVMTSQNSGILKRDLPIQLQIHNHKPKEWMCKIFRRSLTNGVKVQPQKMHHLVVTVSISYLLNGLTEALAFILGNKKFMYSFRFLSLNMLSYQVFKSCNNTCPEPCHVCMPKSGLQNQKGQRRIHDESLKIYYW